MIDLFTYMDSAMVKVTRMRAGLAGIMYKGIKF